MDSEPSIMLSELQRQGFRKQMWNNSKRYLEKGGKNTDARYITGILDEASVIGENLLPLSAIHPDQRHWYTNIDESRTAEQRAAMLQMLKQSRGTPQHVLPIEKVHAPVPKHTPSNAKPYSYHQNLPLVGESSYSALPLSSHGFISTPFYGAMPTQTPSSYYEAVPTQMPLYYGSMPTQTLSYYGPMSHSAPPMIHGMYAGYAANPPFYPHQIVW